MVINLKRLIRKAETITHDFVSPYWLWIADPNGDMHVNPAMEWYERDANAFMKDDFEDAKPIIIENLQEDGVETVIDILVNLNDGKMTATVTFSQEPTKETLDMVAKELEGQYADGWGEGLEQYPFTQEEEEEEVEYEDDEGGYYTESEPVMCDVCLKLWNHEGFSMTY
jgi:hypothetical protein